MDGRAGNSATPVAPRLAEVTEERLAQKLEERQNLPQKPTTFRDRIPDAFGHAGTRVSTPHRSSEESTKH